MMAPRALDGLRWFTMAAALSVGMAAAPPTVAAQDAGDKSAAEKIDPQHPLAPAIEHAYKARAALQNVKDYTAVFSRREFVGNGLKASTMNMKFREEPFSVYLQFGKPNEGREVLYVAGKNNNQLWAHDVGVRAIVGTVSLAPNSNSAMDDSRYPITMIGLRTMLERVIAQWEAEGKFGETFVQYYPNAKLGECECNVIESWHPQPRKQFKFHKTRLFIDKETGLAIRVEQLGFPQKGDKAPPVMEEYTYMSIKTNVGLTDADFDIKNPNYAFP